MRRHVRHSVIIAAIGLLALAMSGCVIIKSQSSVQLEEIGSVQITTTACASDTNSSNSPPEPGCQGAGSGGNSATDADSESMQLLLAYRIPTNVTTPSAITSTNPGGPSAITFNQSSTYTTELTSKQAPPAGQKWVGYLSTTQSFVEVGGQQSFTVAPQFGLPQSADGSPYQGPFDYRVIVGNRTVDGTRLASRPVTCLTPITTLDNGDRSICADSPSSGVIATNVQQPTQDLGILESPTPESVKQGNVARVHFDAVFAGDGNPEPTFSLTASTDVPDAEALPNTPTLTPSEGSNPARVTFRAPVDTPPDTYFVTLTAALANGQIRSSTRELMVTPTTVRCDELTPTIAGTRQDDVLKGTSGRDVIAGYAGNDRVVGLAGNDVICVGKGDDEVRGGNGNDRIAGRRGDDLLTGGRGHNLIRTGPGKDQFLQ